MRLDLVPATAWSHSRSSWSPRCAPTVATASAGRLLVAIIGDCHSQWDERDAAALELLAPDLALFVGDFGNQEDKQTVAAVAASSVRHKASIFGNHDVMWLTRKWRGHHPLSWYRGHAATKMAMTHDERPVFSDEAVEELHRLLEDSDVGYRRRDFDALGLSVVGGRPFSSGGQPNAARPHLQKSKFYRWHWRVRSLEQSAARIVRAARGAPPSHDIIMLAHNGPAGLGGTVDAPCGRDWSSGARKVQPRDWGDADLRMALDEARASGLRVPLVAFGHMHERLQRGAGVELRRMVAREGATTFVNAARVPRWRDGADGEREGALTLVELARDGDGGGTPTDGDGGGWEVERVRQVWLSAAGEVTEERIEALEPLRV